MTKTITLTDEQYQALTSGQAITIEPPKPEFKLNMGCFFIDSKGEVYTATYGTQPSATRYNNVFKTHDNASAAAKEIKTFNALLQRWLDLVGDWRPDWEDDWQNKYYAICNNGEWSSVSCRWVKVATPFYFPTEESCQTFIDDMRSYLDEVGV